MIGSFNQNVIDFLDFTRCVRPDGTAYGTGGTCRKGVEQEKTTTLSSQASEVVTKYADELAKVWPGYSREEMVAAVKQYISLVELERQRVANGEVKKEEIDDFASTAELPDFKGKKFAIIGMEPGMTTEDSNERLAIDLAKHKMGSSQTGAELADMATYVVRSLDPTDGFARTAVGIEPKRQRGHTFANQLAYIKESSLRPEQLLLSTAHGNVRAISAPGIGVKGVYEAINSQKDPRLSSYGRKESAAQVKGRMTEIVRRLRERGRDSDFEGGLFAPGKNKESLETISSFVQEFKASGGRVIEHTTMIGKNADTPMKTYTLQLENGKPFVIFEGSLSSQKLAASNLKRAYNDVLTNFVKETN